MIVLGIDPGFATCGLAAVDVTPGAERVVELQVVRTEKSKRKLDVRASDDNVRRASELEAALSVCCSRHRPVALACDWPRDATTSAKVGIAWGVVVAVAHRFAIPIVQASPQAQRRIKQALCGSKTATKDDVILAIEQRFPGVQWPEPPSLREHAADAAAAVLACMDSSALQMARRLSA
jgi:Holliday junction resolvasome RuvABC endonuclease subunit